MIRQMTRKAAWGRPREAWQE